MAHSVKLKIPGSGVFVEYKNFVFLPDEVSGGGQSIAGGGTSQSTQQVTLQKSWELGQPPTVQFFVGGTLGDLGSFVKPVQGTEVWIDSDTFPNFFTGFITNQVEVVPVGSPPGADDDPANQLYGYVCACQGHEILLNMNLIGFIPPFTNMTTGDILAALGDRLVPGRFDWSGVRGFGDVIPIYETQPTQRFFDVVSDLLNNFATKLWFVRYTAFIEHYDEGDPSVEPTFFETDKDTNPYDIAITPIQNAIVNDVTGVGDTEPQVYAREYSVGDGITTAYPIKLPVFGTLGKPIVADDFTQTNFDPSIWQPFGVGPNDSSDPSNAFQLFNGRLNVVGGLGLNSTKLLLALGIEIKGSVNVDAGEIQFVDATNAIIGGLYTSETLSLANCKFGFRVTGGGGGGTATISEHPSGTVNGTNVTFFTSQVPASGFTLTVNGTAQHSPADYTLSGNVITFVVPPPPGATIVAAYTYATGGGVGIAIQAIVNGALVGDIVTTKPSNTYSLHIKISTPAQQTTLPPWYSSGSAFGGGSQSAPVTVSFLVEEFSQLAVRLPNEFHVHQETLTGVPAFLFLGEFAINTANFAINYFQITQPIQGSLLTQLISDDSQKIRTLGFVGESDADATVTETNESESLTFFKESRPVLRQRNEFRYRSAGPAVARVTSNASIAAQAASFGDSGVRSAVLTSIKPLPATAEQLEWALQAYLDDNDSQQFEGSLTAIVPPTSVTGLVGSPGAKAAFAKPMTEPIPGRFINVHYPHRTPETPAGFSELIKVVNIAVTTESDDGTLEQFEIDLSFGLVVTREMSKILPKFTPQDPLAVATLRQIENIPPIDTTMVGTAFIEDAPNFALVDKDSGNFYYDIGQNLLTGESVEVRYSDASWGKAGANFILNSATRTFSLPRLSRDQTVYARIVNESTSITSRYSGMVRTLYPMVPPQPSGSEVDASDFFLPRIHFDLPPDTRDIFGILIQAARTLASGAVTLVSNGADARGMLVVGQDANGAYMEEKIFLNGTTPVTTTKSFNWILWVNSDYRTVLNEIPYPQTDGTTLNFNLSGNPIAGTITVAVDGVTATVGVDYNIVGNQIQFINPPTSGSQILVGYLSLEDTTRIVTISSPVGTLGTLGAGLLEWLANPIIYRYEDLSFGGSNQDPALTFTFDNSAEDSVATIYVYFYNLLDELSLPLTLSPSFGSPPTTSTNQECLDVRNFGAKGDGITNDTNSVQAALDQAARNVAGPTTAVGTPTVIARPTVSLNGWGANAHVGDYEHGVTQGHFWGTDSGTTLPYAVSGNGAKGIQQHTHQYAGIVWAFAAVATPSPSTAQRFLEIDSEVPLNNDSGVIVTDRDAGIWYTLDNGTNWTKVYQANFRARQVDSILLPAGQDMSHVQVMAFMDSHDDMAHYINDVNLTQNQPVGSQIQASGPTLVCIPSGVNCMVGGLVLNGNLPSDQVSNKRALNIQTGVSIKIDGSLNLFDYTGLVPQTGQFIAKELIGTAAGANNITITGAGKINGNGQPGVDQDPLIDLHGHDFTISGTLAISQWGGAVGSGPFTLHTGIAINIALDSSNTNTSIDGVTGSSVYQLIKIVGTKTGGSTLATATFSNGVSIAHCIADPCFYCGIAVSLVQKLLIENCRFSLIGQSGAPSFDGGISITDCKNFTIDNNICLNFDSGYVPLESGAGIAFNAGTWGCSDGIVTKNTCNNCNDGIVFFIVDANWVRIEISFNICNNSRTFGIFVNVASGAQFNIHDNSATGNTAGDISPTPAQIATAAAGGTTVTGYTNANPNVSGAVSTIAGQPSNNPSLGGVDSALIGSYTVNASDAGKLIQFTGVLTGNVLTLPAGLNAQFCCAVVNAKFPGSQVALTPAAGVRLNTLTTPINLPYEGGAWLFFDGTNWFAVGLPGSPFSGGLDVAGTGNLGPTAIYQPQINMAAQISVYCTITSITGAPTMQATFSWTDENGNNQTAVSAAVAVAGGSQFSFSAILFSQASRNIIYSITIAGTGTVTYTAHVRLLLQG